MTCVEDARVVAVELLARGCGSVVVTMGETGCLVAEAGAQTADMVHVTAPKVTAVDTTVTSASLFATCQNLQLLFICDVIWENNLKTIYKYKHRKKADLGNTACSSISRVFPYDVTFMKNFLIDSRIINMKRLLVFYSEEVIKTFESFCISKSLGSEQ